MTGAMKPRRSFLLLCLLLLPPQPTAVAADPPHRYYLLDFGAPAPPAPGSHVTGHLLVFNPGAADAELTLTLYFEDRDPVVVQRRAPAGKSSEFGSGGLGVPPGQRVAVEVRSSEPVVCQATIGWTNTGGDYSPGARTSSPRGRRETAKSYLAIDGLARRWFIADGVVLDGPGQLWIRESEWALVLNPGDSAARVELKLRGQQWDKTQVVEVAPRRLRSVFMDDVAPRNQHYGAELASDVPIAAQWLREVRWYDSAEPMAVWSVPALPEGGF